MDARELIERLRVSGTGESKLAVLRARLDRDPGATAEDCIRALARTPEHRQRQAYVTTINKASEILEGKLPPHEQDPKNLIVASAERGAGVGPRRAALLLDEGRPRAGLPGGEEGDDENPEGLPGSRIEPTVRPGVSSRDQAGEGDDAPQVPTPSDAYGTAPEAPAPDSGAPTTAPTPVDTGANDPVPAADFKAARDADRAAAEEEDDLPPAPPPAAEAPPRGGQWGKGKADKKK